MGLGFFFHGGFSHYLSGSAAVETAGEEVAAAHAAGRPHRDSMRFDRIAQFKCKIYSLRDLAANVLQRQKTSCRNCIISGLAKQPCGTGPRGTNLAYSSLVLCAAYLADAALPNGDL